MSLIRKYDHLFFDLDNTLWDFDVNARLTMQGAVQKLKLQYQITDFISFFNFFDQTNGRLWELYRKQEIRQQELVWKRFEITIDHFGLTGVNPEDFNQVYLSLMPEFTSLVKGALETLDYLKAKGYQLHILTNGLRQVQERKVRNSRLSPYFKNIFASEDICAPKPDKRIFRHALMHCNAKKQKSMMIGDTWETDIIGASRMGIDSVFFIKNDEKELLPSLKLPEAQKKYEFPETSPAKNHYLIKKLTEIKEIL